MEVNINSTGNPDLQVVELQKQLHGYKQANIELLEDKRLLLLRSQEAHKLEYELKIARQEVQQLKCQLCELTVTQELNDAEKNSDTHVDTAKNFILKETKLIELDETIESTEESRKTSDLKEYIKNDVRKKLTKQRMDPKQDNGCCCGIAEKYAEVVKINHYWQKDYTSLQDECKLLKARLWKTERELEHLIQENKDIRINNDNFKNDSNETSTNSGNNAPFTLDDIEALKQQEDYDAEKEDNKRITVEQNRMKLELQKAYAIIDDLTLKNSTMKEKYRRVSHEKEKIIMELRRLSTSSLPLSPITTECNLVPRFPSNESLEDLRCEDAHPNSGGLCRTPPSFHQKGHVVRDGPVKRKSFSFDTIHSGRTSPPINHRGRLSPPCNINHRGRLSPPNNHIDFKEISS